MTDKVVGMVAYCDGSSKPNGSYSGYGIFGYLYTSSKTAKNTKHPYKSKYYFTDNGITDIKSDTPIEVTDILEVVSAINAANATNNLAEISAVIRTFQIAKDTEGLTELNVITDSNYVVSSYNDSLQKWVMNGWVRQDGKDLSHVDKWKSLYQLGLDLQLKGVAVTLSWVKGHSGDYGNEMSDLLSSIASNAARYQYETNVEVFTEDILNTKTPYKSYKESYNEKDFVYFFKDLFFSSAHSDDTSFCFICTTSDEREAGKRNNTSIFVANVGHTPDFINNIRKFYRNLKRNYVAPCSVKISKLTDRDKLRIASIVDIAYLLRPMYSSPRNAYSFVGDDTVFMHENTVDFPFISNITMLTETLKVCDDPNDQSAQEIRHDVTSLIVSDKKLLITNTDKFVDFSTLDCGNVVFKQKLIAAVGYDLPTYLALKNIEEVISNVTLILRREPGSNFYTLYIRITTHDRIIMCLNVPNKYLVVAG